MLPVLMPVQEFLFCSVHGLISPQSFPFAVAFNLTECRQPADIALAIDSSSSIGDAKYNQLLEFSRYFASLLNIGPGGSQLAVETYADTNTVRFQLNKFNNKSDVVVAISFPFMTGKTMTAQALKTMRQVIFSRECFFI